MFFLFFRGMGMAGDIFACADRCVGFPGPACALCCLFVLQRSPNDYFNYYKPEGTLHIPPKDLLVS